MSLGLVELMEEQKRLREEEPSLYGRPITGEAIGALRGFLGIDVGIKKRTSWALVDKAGEVLQLGDVPVDPEMRNDRYAQLAVDLYRDLPWDGVEVVGVEWPWVGPNRYSAQAIGMATGVVLAVGALFGKEVMLIDPSQAKKALTGDHLAPAHKMRLEAETRWPEFKVGEKKPTIHGDRASAIGIALAVWERRR